AGLFEHPQADRQDLAGVLGHRDELGRRALFAVRRVPAQQRLDAAHAAVAQADGRLVDQAQFVAAERLAQLLLQRQLALHALVETVVVVLVAVAAVFLRRIHRGVGGP